MLYRVMQFINTLNAKLDNEDIKFINSYLNQKEKKLFNQLKVYEQKHCLRVAKGVEAYDSTIEEDQLIQLIRAGLLHDIGKIKHPLNPVEKSIIVVLHSLTKGKIKKLTSLKIVKCYYDHPEIGYALLKEMGEYPKAFLDLIHYHHSDVDLGEALRILKACDSLA